MLASLSSRTIIVHFIIQVFVYHQVIEEMLRLLGFVEALDNEPDAYHSVASVII